MTTSKKEYHALCYGFNLVTHVLWGRDCPIMQLKDNSTLIHLFSLRNTTEGYIKPKDEVEC